MSNPVEAETTLDESFSVTVPASVRTELGLDAGDRLRWRVDGSDVLTVEVVRNRNGAFSELESVELDESTDATKEHDDVANEF